MSNRAGRPDPSERRPLAMFPLGTVLFPGGTLPLHVFEQRYRAMVRDCLDTDRTFGVVLIARGSEVGGGDERFGIGTEARIERASALPDGRWVLLATGTTRVEVGSWLPDDPYPRATVARRASTGTLPDPTLAHALAAVRRAAALLAELGGSGGILPGPRPDGDPEAHLWSLCDAAPLGALDRQALLELDDLGERTERLVRLTGEVCDDLVRMLSEAP